MLAHRAKRSGDHTPLMSGSNWPGADRSLAVLPSGASDTENGAVNHKQYGEASLLGPAVSVAAELSAQPVMDLP
jgi:hypothetical protein